MSFYLFIICGFVAGVLGGMGMGGGTLLIPLLTLFLSVPQKIAQCANLVAFFPMALLSLVIHTKNRLVRYRDCLLPLLFAAVVSPLFVFLAFRLPSVFLKKGFGVFLCVLSVFQMLSAVKIVYKKRKKR